MANITLKTSTDALPPTTSLASSVARGSLSLIKEVIAISFWAYAICKIFIFDVDVVLINYINPRYIWIAEYKFLIILGLLSTALLITKNKYLLAWSAYVLFYPIILLCWKLPRVAFRKGDWLFLFALVIAAISAFKSFKYKFVAFTIFSLSTFVTLVSTEAVTCFP